MKNKYLYIHFLDQIFVQNNLKARNVGTNMWTFFENIFDICIKNKSNPHSILVEKTQFKPKERFKTYLILENKTKIQIKGINEEDACSTVRQKIEYLYLGGYIEKYFDKSKEEFCKKSTTEFVLNNLNIIDEKLKAISFEDFYIKFFTNECKQMIENSSTEKKMISISFMLALIISTKEMTHIEIAKYIIYGSGENVSVKKYAENVKEIIEDNSYLKDIKERLKLSETQIKDLIVKIYSSISKVFKKEKNAISKPQNKQNINKTYSIETQLQEMANSKIEDMKNRKLQNAWRIQLFIVREQFKRDKDDLGNLDLKLDKNVIEAAHIYPIAKYKEKMKQEYYKNNYEKVIDLYEECWSIHNGLLLDPTTHKKYDKKESYISKGNIFIKENKENIKLEYPRSEPSFAYEKPKELFRSEQ